MVSTSPNISPNIAKCSSNTASKNWRGPKDTTFSSSPIPSFHHCHCLIIIAIASTSRYFVRAPLTTTLPFATMALSPLPAKPKGVKGFDALATVLTDTFFKEKQSPKPKSNQQPSATRATQIAFKELKSSFRESLNAAKPKTKVDCPSRSPVAVSSILTPTPQSRRKKT